MSKPVTLTWSMDSQIVELLRKDTTNPLCQYAAARIEELEQLIPVAKNLLGNYYAELHKCAELTNSRAQLAPQIKTLGELAVYLRQAFIEEWEDVVGHAEDRLYHIEKDFMRPKGILKKREDEDGE